MKQTVLITGASRGIGAAAAKLFAAEGYRVAVCCHTQMEKAEELAASLPDAAAFAADIACEEEVSQMIDAVHRRFGEIHVLINNASPIILSFFFLPFSLAVLESILPYSLAVPHKFFGWLSRIRLLRAS